MAKFIQKFNAAVDDGLVKDVFDHIRNFLYAATILAAGSFSARHDEQALYGLIISENLGIGIILFGIFLMLLNLYGGLRRLSKLNHPVLLSILLTLIYVLASIRVVEVMWTFRDIK